MAGWVYGFASPSMPGVIKIGATRRELAERLAEANASDTWRPPHAYVVACAAEVTDPFACERAIHTLLAARRVNHRAEFFEITADEASALFSLLAPASRNEHNEQKEQSAQSEQKGQNVPEQRRVSRAAAVPCPPAACAAQIRTSTPEGKLRAWVEGTFTRISPREKGTGTKLEVLYSAYAATVPPVHTRPLGKILFAKMLNVVCPGVGPHRGSDGSKGIFLLRCLDLPV